MVAEDPEAAAVELMLQPAAQAERDRHGAAAEAAGRDDLALHGLVRHPRRRPLQQTLRVALASTPWELLCCKRWRTGTSARWTSSTRSIGTAQAQLIRTSCRVHLYRRLGWSLA